MFTERETFNKDGVPTTDLILQIPFCDRGDIYPFTKAMIRVLEAAARSEVDWFDPSDLGYYLELLEAMLPTEEEYERYAEWKKAK